MKKYNTVRDNCKDEVLRRKLYRRIKEVNSLPSSWKNDFFGLYGEELYPVYQIDNKYWIKRGKKIDLSLEIPKCKFTRTQLQDMGFKFHDFNFLS